MDEVSVAQRSKSMTPLSHRGIRGSRIGPFGHALARRSHGPWNVVPGPAWLFAAVVSTAGCVVANPPDVQLPTKTPPVLNYVNAQPLITQIVQVPVELSATQLPFTVRVRSEDLGDSLAVLPYLDYNAPTQAVAGQTTFVDPSSFDDDQRVISVTLSKSSLSLGCRQFTLLVTHTDNLVHGLKDDADKAIITWWLDVHSSSSTPATLESCPRSAGSSGG